MKNAGKLFLGLTTMFAAGVALGVLYAPDKGDRTRKKLARKGKWVFDKVDDTIEDSKDAMEDLRDRLKDDLEKLNSEIKRMSKC